MKTDANPSSSAAISAADTPAEMFGRLARFDAVADGVWRLCTVFVNCYAVQIEDQNGSKTWMLIDSGLPGTAVYIQAAARRQFGNRPPKAIVLTHGHFDHAGNARSLATSWNVPIFASRLELPYLNGQSDYPPHDPTPGGAICFLSRFFPLHAVELGSHLTQMPDDRVPEMPGWRVIATPGHTVGHVSLFRESDGFLIAGDALATTDMDAWPDHLNWPRILSRPPTPFTPDWPAACDSIRRLADLGPKTVAPGHGLPVASADLGNQLRSLANATEPPKGRYTASAPEFDETGAVKAVPPAVPDPIGQRLLMAALGAVALGGIALGMKKQKSDS